MTLFGFKSCYQFKIDESDNRAQSAFRKDKVTPLLKELNDLGNPELQGEINYLPEPLLTTLGEIAQHAESLRSEASDTYAYLKNNEGEQPQHICDSWVKKRGKLDALLAALSTCRSDAENVYNNQLASWQRLAERQVDGEADYGARIDALAARIETLSAAAKTARSKVRKKPDGVAYLAYTIDLKRMEGRRRKKDHAAVGGLAYLKQAKAVWSARCEAETAAYKELFTEDGEINYGGEPLQKAGHLLAVVNEPVSFDVSALVAPTLLPAPGPKPFVADIHLSTTGDLADSLLVPLVEQWLRARKATPLKGDCFEWVYNAAESTQDLEIKVPPSLQGATEGVLRIRITTERQGNSVFSGLAEKGKADIVLTGRKMSPEDEQIWLPKGKTLPLLDPDGFGRSFRTRLCSDALVFFCGESLNLPYVTSQILHETPKVFSDADAALAEAVEIAGLHPEAIDYNSPLPRKNPAEVTRGHPDKICLGTWHADVAKHHAGSALAVKDSSALGFSTCWNNPKVLETIPPLYRSAEFGCKPTEPTINTGQYAFAYNICFYRSIHPRRYGAVSADFMQYTCDVNNRTVGKLVRNCGFVPLQFDLIKRNQTLTDKDLPLKLLIRRMEQQHMDMGYDEDTSTWVYGVKIPIPLYYETGGVSADKTRDVVVDADSRYYTDSQAVQIIRNMAEHQPVCLVLVGHADPQWRGGLDTGAESWRENLKISQERADGIYHALFSERVGMLPHLTHLQIGSSWARPASDINLGKPKEAQEQALGRCRRVDIFLVFPMSVQ